MSIDSDLTQEIALHVIHPKNYGIIKKADGVGIAKDVATDAYIIMYLSLENTKVVDVKFSTSGNQDTNALGSMLTEMIIGDNLENIDVAVNELEEGIQHKYKMLPKPSIEGESVEAISTVELDNANMVLTAYRAAIRHYERKKENIVEESFTINISKMCPYSQSDCAIG